MTRICELCECYFYSRHSSIRNIRVLAFLFLWHERGFGGRQGAAHGGGDGGGLLHQICETLGFERLPAIGEGHGGVGVDFNDQAIGSGGDGSPRHRFHIFPVAGAVAGVE